MTMSHSNDEVCEHRYMIGVFKDGQPTEWSDFPDTIEQIAGCSEAQAYVRDFSLRNERAWFDITRTRVDHFQKWLGLETAPEDCGPPEGLLGGILAALQASREEFHPTREEHERFHAESVNILGREVPMGDPTCSVCGGEVTLSDAE